MSRPFCVSTNSIRTPHATRSFSHVRALGWRSSASSLCDPAASCRRDFPSCASVTAAAFSGCLWARWHAHGGRPGKKGPSPCCRSLAEELEEPLWVVAGRDPFVLSQRHTESLRAPGTQWGDCLDPKGWLHSPLRPGPTTQARQGRAGVLAFPDKLNSSSKR